jgi:heat shock protein HslJ
MSLLMRFGSLSLVAAGLFFVACTPGGQEPELGVTPTPSQTNDEMIVFVAPYQVDCEGEGPQKCLLIREDPSDEYQLFYFGIKGFEFEPGYSYQLKVKKEKVDNPPAGGSSLQWTLVEMTDKSISLEGNLWGLESYIDEEGQLVDALPGSKVTAEFINGSVTGSAGCNNYFGTYELSGNSLALGPVAMTEMYCAEPGSIMDQESQYLSALQASVSIQQEEDRLNLINAAGETVLVYSLVQPVMLEGTPWVLSGYNNGKNAVVSILAGSEITAEFVEGTVSGSAGCNNYHAGYELAGEHISIGPAAATRMFCAEPEGIMDQENSYLQALEMASTFEIKSDTLQMYDRNGARVLTYYAASETGGGEMPAVADDKLANLEYMSEATLSGIAPLVDGEYREKVDPDAASETIVRLTEHISYGQLADGQEAAAVVLVTTTGGSGTFFDLAFVQEIEGQPTNTASVILGDRVIVNNLVFVGGEILVEMVAHGPDDPLCCPGQEVVITYELQGDELVQSSSRIVGTNESGEAEN